MKQFTTTFALALTAWVGDAASKVRTFSTENLKPPVWLNGEYYTANVGLFDQYLYVVPQLYILSTSEFAPKNGAIIQMYVQFDGNSIADPTTSEEAEIISTTRDYESWSCNMLYFDDVSDKSQDDMIEVFFYRGSSNIGQTSGTYSGVNALEEVELSAWKNDPDLTTVALSEKNAVKE